MRRKRPAQPFLFEPVPGTIPFDPPARPRARGRDGSGATRAFAPERPGGGQLRLFTSLGVFNVELQRALGHADLDEARRIRDRLEEEYGRAAVPPGLAFLDSFPERFWERSLDLDRRLAAWERAERLPPEGPSGVPAVRIPFFRRMVDLHEPERIVARRPRYLGPVYAALCQLDRRSEARRLVRGTLLSGRRVDSEVVDDPPVAELLSENLSPRWLASLGAMRRLWPLPRPDDAEIEALATSLAQPVPSGDDDRALAFWDTLRLAELRNAIPEDLLRQARIRLKRLHREIHAEYMGQRSRDAGFL